MLTLSCEPDLRRKALSRQRSQGVPLSAVRFKVSEFYYCSFNLGSGTERVSSGGARIFTASRLKGLCDLATGPRQHIWFYSQNLNGIGMLHKRLGTTSRCAQVVEFMWQVAVLVIILQD